MLKNILRLYFALIFTNITAYSQTFFLDVNKTKWLPVIIEKSDHSIMTGYVKEFGIGNRFQVHGAWDDFRSMESQLHMDQKEFEFKKTPESDAQKILIDDLESITIVNDDQTPFRFDKVKLKTINSDMQIVDLNRKVLIPLSREGKINLYSIQVEICSPNCIPGPVIAYIKKPGDEFAYIPIDINRLNIFNIGSLEGKMLESFRQVSKNCPEFLKYLDDWERKSGDKEFRKSVKARWKAVDKEKEEALKTLHDSKQRRKIENDYYVKRFLTWELDMIEKYESMCN